MSSNSRARDTYEAKMAGKEPDEVLRMLMQSPYRKHRQRGERVLKLAQALDEIRKEKEAQLEVPDAV